MREEVAKFEFVQFVSFDLIDFLGNKRKNVLLKFDDSCQNKRSSRECEKLDVTGRHRGLGTYYFKRIFFHKRELDHDIQLQNPHNNFFK